MSCESPTPADAFYHCNWPVMLADHGLDKDSSSEIWPKLEVRYLCRNRCKKIWKAADTGFVSKLAAYLLTITIS